MTTWTGTVPTIASGDTTTVPTNLATYRDVMKALSEPRGSWTPTYTGITAIGNATVVARYLQVGKLVVGHYLATFGSTTTYNASSLTVSLPATPRDDGAVLGTVFAIDTSATVRVSGVAVASTGTSIFLGSTSSGIWTGTATPWVWANGDILRFEFSYEAA